MKFPSPAFAAFHAVRSVSGSADLLDANGNVATVFRWAVAGRFAGGLKITGQWIRDGGRTEIAIGLPDAASCRERGAWSARGSRFGSRWVCHPQRRKPEHHELVAFDGEGKGPPVLYALEPVLEVEKFGAQAGIKIAPAKKCPMATGPRGFLKGPHRGTGIRMISEVFRFPDGLQPRSSVAF